MTQSAFARLAGIDARALARQYWGRTFYWRQPERGASAIAWSHAACVAALERGAQAVGAKTPLASCGMRILAEQIAPMSARGFAVAGEALSPETCSLAAAFKSELGIAGTVASIGCIVPAGAVQQTLISEAHRIVVVTEGSARWTLTRGGERLESTLSAGAFLYAPPGSEFRVEGIERTVAFIAAFTPVGMQAVVEMLIRRSYGEEPRWRAVPAAGPNGAHREYVEEGLSRMRSVLEGIRPDHPVVKQVWEEMIADAGPAHNRYALSLVQGDTAVEPDSRLRVTPYLPVRGLESTGTGGSREYVVFLGTRHIRDSGPGAGILEHIVRGGEFTAADAVEWLGEGFGWDAVGPYLENLMEQGLLVVSSAKSAVSY